jgi:DNA-binding transcriptional MerR regulator
MFTPGDIKNLRIIYHLVKEKGMTLAGVKKQLTSKWDETDYKFEIGESLKNIKGMLLEIRDSI